MSEWISVKDRLPLQDGSPFLGYQDNEGEGDLSIYVIRYQNKKAFEDDYNYVEAGGEEWSRWNPTHWMPLPETPTE